SKGKIEIAALPTVNGYSLRLRQMFQNLVANALKFRGDKAPVVKIAAKEMPEGWDITVADNGIGIEPEYFDRIFGAFKRLHSYDQYEGTGIGLSICKKVVEKHKGRIGVES